MALFVAFQSPSLRGSGRFMVYALFGVVPALVSIPFIAGQWSLQEDDAGKGEGIRVSIPFIAGQWSLLELPPRRTAGADKEFQSPSLRGSGRFATPKGAPPTPPRFNPLHCGAVVASVGRTAPGDGGSSSFNPLHCGAVVASRVDRVEELRGPRFQSPSLRGSGRFLTAPSRRTAGGQVSIPFIAGQWSLPAALVEHGDERDVFQSPSLRGSGRFARCRRQLVPLRRRFQSPSLRGSGRFSPEADRDGARRRGFNPLHCGAVVASRPLPPAIRQGSPCFNPLHCGAVVAS